MRVLMTEDSNNAVSNSFLLDDDSRLVIRFYYPKLLPLPFCAPRPENEIFTDC